MNRELLDGDRAVVAAMVASAVMALARLRRQGWWDEDPGELLAARRATKFKKNFGFQYAEFTEEGKWWASEGPELLFQLTEQVLGRIYTRSMVVRRAIVLSKQPDLDVLGILTGKDGE